DDQYYRCSARASFRQILQTYESKHFVSLVQRCVIIQRDENGFGLTVSGDNPVFVQLVKEDGAAMRAGVQTGDRIIKVNGTLVTHSNHIEVVKLIKSGSYVALTVLGRPPGLTQIPLEEEEEEKGEGGKEENKTTHSQKIIFVINPRPKLLKEIQDAKKHISLLQEQLNKAAVVLQVLPHNAILSILANEDIFQRGENFTLIISKTSPLPKIRTEITPKMLIIGVEDDYFDSQQEQINEHCSCFQSIDLLKSRPAHLAVFLHHVVSQFDPAPLLCYLYADMLKQTSSKENRRMFIEFHSFFMDRAANLKVPVPETIAAELEKRRLELIPEDLCKQYTQTLQEALLPDLHKNLEDFRQKRSMGLTLAEDELSKLDVEKGNDQQALEKECACAEHILSKIEDILLTPQPSEEEKCQMMQYVILTYMKHLGVKVKEPRGLEHKRVRINFLPKIKKTIKPEKEGEEKVKKPRFPNILGPPRRLSRVDSTSGENKTTVQLSSFIILKHYRYPISGRKEMHRSGISYLLCDNKEKMCCLASFPLSFVNNRLDMQCGMSSADIQSEDDQGGEVECEEDPLTWQSLVSRGVLASLTPQEIKRQEVINELFYTERAHLRMLKALDCVFYQRLNRDGILPPEDIKHIFINLDEIIQLHVSITEQMMAIRKRNETSVIELFLNPIFTHFTKRILNIHISHFYHTICYTLQILSSFHLVVSLQEAESNRLCRRLQLKDIIPVEMQRVTKYPLLLDNIAKYTVDAEEREKVKKAGECCKKILNHVNQAVKEQCLSLLLIKSNKAANLDLTKRRMIHEGPLSWKVNKDKTIELYTILLEDILVLLQKQDERLVLKFHGKNLASATDTKHIFSPIIKLNTVLVRPVATDNRSFFVLSMSENGAQIYELTAQTVSDQRIFDCSTQITSYMLKIYLKICFEVNYHLFSSNLNTHPDKDDAASQDIQAPPTSINPFDGLKSEDEEDELVVADTREEEGEEEEVDEAELEAFLDAQLAERLPFLQQEGSRQGFAIENQEHIEFSIPTSKAEDALRTCKL
uniref:Rho guanine nucleotide exchange factor (GEF) 12b n=1 Tax=Mastacembelus armatus TaxID=205130 RepID=A0A7N8XBM7_9TELE